MSAVSVELLVIAVIKSASDVLLVGEATATGDGTAWVLPGGQVASGELAVEALAREIKEETGLMTEGLPKLVAVAQCYVRRNHDGEDAPPVLP